MPTTQVRPVVKEKTASLEEQSASIGSGLQVGISSFGAWMLGVGTNIGSWAFLIHGSMIAQAGQLASISAWLIAAVMIVPLALVLAELSSMFPSAGGPYVYKYFALKRLIPGMGEMLGFLTGWMFWICFIASYACMANGLVNLLSTTIYGAPQSSPLWFGPAVIVVLFGGTTLLNLMQVQSAARLNSFFTVLKLAVAAGFGLLAFSAASSSWTNLWQAHNLAGGDNFWANVACVLPLAMAGFSGIELVGCTSSETQDARKSVPKAILMTVLTVGLVYIGMCVAISVASPYVLSPDKSMAMVAGTKTLATAPSMATYLGGPLWGLFVTGGVVLSIVSCGFGGLLTCARTSLSMAQTGLFPQQFAKINPVSKVPEYALVFQCFFMLSIAIAANLLCRSGLVADAYTFLGGTCAFLYGLLAMLYGVCLIGLRYTDPEMSRPFRIGNTALAVVIALGSMAVYGFVAFACSSWNHQLAGVFLLALGIPIYLYYRRPTTPSTP